MTLSEEQQVVLQTIYDEFKKSAKWPVFQHLDIVLDQEHGLEAEPLLMALREESLVRLYTPVRRESEVALRVAGLAHCEGSEDDLVLFGRALQWTVEKERGFRPSSPSEVEQQIVTSEQAAGDWGEAGFDVSDLALQKAYQLLAGELIYEGQGGDDTSWQIHLSPRIRRFRGVRNYQQYLEAIADDQRSQPAANPIVSSGVPAVVVDAPQQVAVVEAGMSLSKQAVEPVLSVDSLHPLVRDAVRPLFAIEHYAQGVEKAVRVLRDVVREKSGLSTDDGDTLMGKALGGKTPPIVVADLETKTGENVQRGTLYLAQGIVARLRNPLTHESGELNAVEALEMAAIISRVLRDLDGAQVATDVARSGEA
jgi:uncharacterized protein (TIGR02391 family)